MKIKVLGCDGGIGGGRRTTSLLIDDRLLLDAGSGVADLSLRAMTRIEHILLTHAHFDHICCLPLLLDTLLTRIDRPVDLHGLAGSLTALREHVFNWQLWADFTQLPSADAPRLAYCPIALEEARSLGGIRVRTFPVAHSVPACGYALESAGGSENGSKNCKVFAFTGDTGTSPELIAALNTLPRLDFLMIEVSYADDDVEMALLSQHLTPMLLASNLAQLRHRPQILLSHPKPGAEKVIREECRQALRDWDFRHLRRGEIVIV